MLESRQCVRYFPHPPFLSISGRDIYTALFKYVMFHNYAKKNRVEEFC
jgi:hypothetical protein